jgi:hypothetical protein
MAVIRKNHTPPNYVVEDGTTQRKPPEVRMWQTVP